MAWEIGSDMHRGEFVSRYEWQQAVLDLKQAMEADGIRGPNTRISEMFGLSRSRVDQIVSKAARCRNLYARRAGTACARKIYDYRYRWYFEEE